MLKTFQHNNSINQNIAFVHLPKNAGMSLRQSLKKHIYVTDHNTPFKDIFKKKIKQLIVVRDPLKRFCSSVKYHVNKNNINHTSGSQENKKYEYTSFLIDQNFVTPNDWASALRDKKHKYHEPVSRIIIGPRPGNYFDLVDDSKISMLWHFAPQHIWIRKPDYVILFENLQQEFNRFCQFHFGTKIKLYSKNQSTTDDMYLERKNAKFISKIFFLDQYFYSKFASKEPHDRLCAGIKT